MLELVALKRAPLTSGISAPAAAKSKASYRATLVIQTRDRVHAAYLNVHGQATLTVDTPTLVCGSFDIGDTDESARGTFAVTPGH